MARLRVHRDGELLVEHRLSVGRNTVGRADHNDLALPGDTISRVHCLITGGPEGWLVLDRSRHGLRVDGQAVVGRAALRSGARIGVGPFELEFSEEGGAVEATAAPSPERGHEQLQSDGPGQISVERAFLRIKTGPMAGEAFALQRARVGVGGPGSALVVAKEGLAAQHSFLRVSRGRVMVEPGAGPALIGGERVRDITPILPGEELRLGGLLATVELRREGATALVGRFGALRGQSPPMQRLMGALRRMAGHHYTVLVVGESGTGKELIARALHDHSPRAGGPYVPLNCGAVSPQLFESVLFGHEKGAFTGADARRDGAFHHAAGGTLFLDEVGELPEETQAKLLRALETGEVRRVGSGEVSWPDVRIVAATNRDLPRMVREGRFREDLYFRLAVLSVEVPPLRERMDDLPLLVSTLCEGIHPSLQVSPAGIDLLLSHRWPGNVRELRNVLTRAWVMGGSPIEPEHLALQGPSRAPPPPASVRYAAPMPPMPPMPPMAPMPPMPPEGLLARDEPERATLQALLDRHGDNRSAVARELGVPRTSLNYRLRRAGLA